MAKPIIIRTSCIGPKGAHLERGTVKEFSDEVTYGLVASGRAVAADTAEGKALAEEVQRERQDLATEPALPAGKKK